MLIEVIPIGGSIDNRALTYFVSDELAGIIQLGCLVEVPFHNALDYALVTGVENREKGEGWLRESYEELEGLRSISRIITTLPFLEPYQIDTIFSLSFYYLVRPHQILSLFLHKSLIVYFEKNNFDSFLPTPLLSSVLEKSAQKSIHLHHHTGASPISTIIPNFIADRTVIAFPDDYSLDAYLRINPIDQNTWVIPERLTETKKHKAFRDVYNGEKNIIIWTRRILYYNLRAYHHILYIEDSLHRSLMRFQHTYKHLEILRRMMPGHFNTTILSSLPSIESMYLLHMGIYKRI